MCNPLKNCKEPVKDGLSLWHLYLEGGRAILILFKRETRNSYERRSAPLLLRPLLSELRRPPPGRGHRARGLLVQPQHPPLEGVPGPAGLPAGVRPKHRHGGPGPGGLRLEGVLPPGGGGHRPPVRLLLRAPD